MECGHHVGDATHARRGQRIAPGGAFRALVKKFGGQLRPFVLRIEDRNIAGKIFQLPEMEVGRSVVAEHRHSAKTFDPLDAPEGIGGPDKVAAARFVFGKEVVVVIAERLDIKIGRNQRPPFGQALRRFVARHGILAADKKTKQRLFVLFSVEPPP